MKNTEKLEILMADQKCDRPTRKDHHIQNRRYNGNPYLRLKAVKEHPRNKIRTLLRSFVSLEEIRAAH